MHKRISLTGIQVFALEMVRACLKQPQIPHEFTGAWGPVDVREVSQEPHALIELTVHGAPTTVQAECCQIESGGAVWSSGVCVITLPEEKQAFTCTRTGNTIQAVLLSFKRNDTVTWDFEKQADGPAHPRSMYGDGPFRVKNPVWIDTNARCSCPPEYYAHIGAHYRGCTRRTWGASGHPQTVLIETPGGHETFVSGAYLTHSA